MRVTVCLSAVAGRASRTLTRNHVKKRKCTGDGTIFLFHLLFLESAKGGCGTPMVQFKER